VTNSDMLGGKARQAMIDIFHKKDATAVDRYFGEPFIQHDPNLADGLAGMKSFAEDIARSPNANIKIYRTLVDEDFVLLHSIYEGVARYGGSTIAFDLFRFKDGKIRRALGRTGAGGASQSVGSHPSRRSYRDR
jgi:predicted SnoaL-like aldol condensation-catalyzing enzyme